MISSNFKPLVSALMVCTFGLTLSACNNTASYTAKKTESSAVHMQNAMAVDGAIQQKQGIQPKTFAAIKTMQKGFSDTTAMNVFNRDVASTVSKSARADLLSWMADRYQYGNGLAVKGVAGKLARTPSKGKARSIVVDANGIEYDQMVKKSLIGAYQFDNITNELSKLKRPNPDNQAILANVTAYLLGDYSELSQGPGKKYYAGNEFEKYLKAVAKDKDFSNIETQVYTHLNAARQNLNNQSQFNAHIINAVAAAQKAIAIRAAYYLSYGAGLESAEGGKFGNISHAVSEGLGMIYALQYTYNPKTGQPYYTADEVKNIINGINLWDKADASEKLIEEAFRLAQRFDFDLAAAES